MGWTGAWAGKLFCVVIALDMLAYYLLIWIWPAHTIDIVPDFCLKKYSAAVGTAAGEESPARGQEGGGVPEPGGSRAVAAEL